METCYSKTLENIARKPGKPNVPKEQNARIFHGQRLQIAKFGEEKVQRRKTLCWLYG
jgi:hypothetical protein